MGFLFMLFALVFIIGFFFLVRLGLQWAQRYLQARQGGQGPVRPSPAGGVRDRGAQSLEARVYRVAGRRGGRITVSDLVLDLDLSVREAEALLEALEDGRKVRSETAPNGLVVYEFPEILARRRKA